LLNVLQLMCNIETFYIFQGGGDILVYVRFNFSLLILYTLKYKGFTLNFSVQNYEKLYVVITIYTEKES